MHPYRMAVVAMVTSIQAPGPEELTMAVVSTVLSATPEVPPSSTVDHPSNMSAKSSSASERQATRIDDSPRSGSCKAAGRRSRKSMMEVYCKESVCPGSGGHARYWQVASLPRFVEPREGWRGIASYLLFRQTRGKIFQCYYPYILF